MEDTQKTTDGTNSSFSVFCFLFLRALMFISLKLTPALFSHYIELMANLIKTDFHLDFTSFGQHCIFDKIKQNLTFLNHFYITVCTNNAKIF